MLKFVDRPRRTRRHGRVKLAYLYGDDPAINAVIAKRMADQTCRQLPRPGQVELFYHVRVFYDVDSDGTTEILRIDVKCPSSHWWSRFYDNKGRRGTVNTHNHFLDNAACLVENIRRYEGQMVFRRLALAGPDAFPLRKVEDLRDLHL